MKTIALDKLRIDGGTQLRAEINQDVVGEYRQKMEDGEKFPPVVAFDDGETFWLADGFHRYYAAKRQGDEIIAVDLRKGTQRDAILFAVGANRDHGLPRSNADKRRAVEALLADDEWRAKSSNWLAKTAGVDPKTVANIKSTMEIHSEEVKTSDGRTMDTSNIGRKPEKVLFDGKTGEVIESPMVETTTLKPFHKPEADDSQDTGIGVVMRPPPKTNKVVAALDRLDELLSRPSSQLSVVELRAIASELRQLIL